MVLHFFMVMVMAMAIVLSSVCYITRAKSILCWEIRGDKIARDRGLNPNVGESMVNKIP